MSDPYAPPELVTLDKPASWLNARGNIDRSACVEVRIGAYRRLVGLMSERQVKVWDEAQNRPTWKWLVEPLPRESAAANRHGRVSSGIVWFDVWTLEEMLYRRVHRPLAGDWRTQRAPAVRAENWTRDERHAKKRGPAWKGFRTRVSMNDRWVEGAPPELPPISPNSGPRRSKVLGLPTGWRQSVRIEKWAIPNRRTPMYYFVCPCGAGLDAARQRIEPGLAKLSTRPLGFQRKGCPQRVLFLMLVQCTAQEWRDAVDAWWWIRSLPAVPPRERVNDWWKLQAMIERLEKRYGILWPPTAGAPGNPAGRTLVCRQCLGVKYGNNPETVRRFARKTRAERRAAREAAALAEHLKRHGPGTLSWVREANDAVGVDDAAGEEAG